MESQQADIVVLGGGPGGYTAAFYAADKGRRVVLVEENPRLGGVCLNKGCIPSKAFLHAAGILKDIRHADELGITVAEPAVNVEKLRGWKESILDRLGRGIRMLAKNRNVEVLTGRGHLEGSNLLRVETPEGQKYITFQKLIIAVGSKPTLPKSFDLGNPRVMTSNEALDVPDIPEDLLVIGGGYIGMEMATVYAALGSRITIIEAMENLLTGADPDLLRPVQRFAQKTFRDVRLSTKVLKMSTEGKKIKVVSETDGTRQEELYDKVLVAVGRAPNCSDMGLQTTRITRDERGFIEVNEHQQTSDPAIFAIGDVAGGVLLAHKAHKEARIAVDVMTGDTSRAFRDIVIPAVVFTDPEVAWCGLTETEAKTKGIEVAVARFPWTASGRAVTLNRTDGLTKLIVDPRTDRILGVGVVGVGAGELISEGVLAIEMGATVGDLASCVHPHPTLPETLMECAELYLGHATNAVSGKKV